ncbi:hypothetical protein HPB51_022723 [Rhipicephalus microplus]|uniref:histone deacetylase n=1 Tax=Rhipicephalus microplus TaxID=6941 RepID=A0A9J6F8C3_RHIMP|nr:hypothetical protein HPB51_022723 [Rhipicephalus microplus]
MGHAKDGKGMSEFKAFESRVPRLLCACHDSTRMLSNPELKCGSHVEKLRISEFAKVPPEALCLPRRRPTHDRKYGVSREKRKLLHSGIRYVVYRVKRFRLWNARMLRNVRSGHPLVASRASFLMIVSRDCLRELSLQVWSSWPDAHSVELQPQGPGSVLLWIKLRLLQQALFRLSADICFWGSTTTISHYGKREPGTSPYHPLNQGGNSDLALYSSPSMPNISLGRPPVATSTADGKILNSVSEAQVRAMAAARLGMPLTSHVLHSSLPFCSPLPVIDGEFTPPTSPGYIQQQMKGLEQSPGAPGHVLQVMYAPPPGTVITDAQVAQARLHRTIHRPLGRTQSAPLPLGHPMLQPQGVLLNAQLFEQQQQHNLLKQHIRQTVLTRAGSKSQVVEHVEEETEAAVAQEMKDQPEVIDLTDSRKGSSASAAEGAPPPHTSGTTLLQLQQRQRDLLNRHSLHLGAGMEGKQHNR